MDDFREDDDDELGDSGDALKVHIVMISIGCFLLGLWICGLRACCCPAQKEPASWEQTPTIKADQLQPRKRLLSSYFLCCMGGLVGAHHFYLGRPFHGIMCLWTLNLFGIGWLADMLLMPKYVYGYNSRHTHPSAPKDTSYKSVLFYFPCTMLLIWLFSIGLFFRGPFLLQRFGVVDIDRLSAQTEANPYEVLGVSYSADMSEVRSAYRKVSLQWHPDRNPSCGSPCELKMAEITKAYELIKKRVAPPPANRGWQDVLKDAATDWWYVFEGLGSESHSDDASKGRQDRTDL